MTELEQAQKLSDELGPMTWGQAHEMLRRGAEYIDEYCGIPTPLPDVRLRLEKRYPYQGLADIYDGGGDKPDGGAVTYRVRNSWYSRTALGLGGWVYLVHEVEPVTKLQSRVKLVFVPSVRSAAERLTYWMATAGAHNAWGVEAEVKANMKLQSLLPEHQYKMYFLCNGFFEASKRSGITYFFRKLRPTVALVPMDRADENKPMKVLATLCLHPIGYYEGTWAGAMCPTDDVIAHLLMMRSDEVDFWRQANHHPLDAPEAGL